MKHLFKRIFRVLGVTITILSLSVEVISQNNPINLLAPISTIQMINQEFLIHKDQKLTASDGQMDDIFGESVALDGDIAVIGALGDDAYTGAVYVFVRHNGVWSQEAKLTASDGVIDAGFGGSVALDRNTLVVGSQWSRAAYVFIRQDGSWTQQAKLTAINSETCDAFGMSVAIESNTVLIGAPGQNECEGAIYEFLRQGNIWTQNAKLKASITAYYLGWSLAMDGDTFVAGDLGGNGSAYVFVRNNGIWSEEQQLIASNGISEDRFGEAVAIDDDRIFVGAPTYQRGKVYSFTRSNGSWSQQQEIKLNDPWFGSSLDIDNNTVIIGSGWDNDYVGTAYVYVYNEGLWLHHTTLASGATEFVDSFGYAVALDGDTKLVGAPQEDNVKGGAYIFSNIPDENVSLLLNGSFEIDTNHDYIPDSWSRKNPVGDGIRCNKAGQPPIASEGQCAYLFKPDTTGGNRLTQNIDLNIFDLNTGDQIKLNGFYNKQSTGSIQIIVYVNYNNFPQDQRKIILTKTTSGYQPVNPIVLTLKDKPTRVRIVLQNDTITGKTWFDDMSLKLTTGNSGIIPLPPVLLPK